MFVGAIVAALVIHVFSLGLACQSDHYLCRMCGLSLGDEGKFVNIPSPFAVAQTNETVIAAGEDGLALSTSILVQKLRNPAGVVFDVITVKSSTCKGVGKWSSEASWFPGYSWKVCVCRQCGRHIGWMLELDSLVHGSHPVKPQEKGFFAIIRGNLLTETIAETLTFVPKIFRQ